MPTRKTIHHPAVKKHRPKNRAAVSQVRKTATEEISLDLRRTKEYRWALEQVRRQFENKEESPMPMDLKPMLASITERPFNDQDWQFEIKWDGYRALAYLADGKAELRSRNNLSFAKKYPSLIKALQQWPVNAVLDGEIVILSDEGKTDFGALQNYEEKGSGELRYYVFDLLWIEGIDLRGEPLHVRREVLKKILPDTGVIHYSESIQECGVDFFTSAKKNGLEGIIAKQREATYEAGTRTGNWLKIKAEKRHEAVICGYSKKRDSERLFSSLILGLPHKDGWQYIGQVGTGFTGRSQREVFKKMNPLFTAECPFSTKPLTNAPTMWIKPRLVCEVKYTALTKDGIMRHPSFQGLRDDKAVADINPETRDVHQQSSGQKEQQRLVVAEKEQALVSLDGHKLALTNLTKLYWPKEKITKGHLLNYYYQMAPYLLPYLKDRPQSLNRFPSGIAGKSFYQKDIKGKGEKWLTTFKRFSERAGDESDYLVCRDAASLLYMANLGCIEMNPWHSKINTPHCPDWCVLDLDPGAIPFEKVIQTAQVVHTVLASLRIPSYPKTSGATGIHIYIPLGAKYTYQQSRQLAELLAILVHHELPRFTSLERNPRKRPDKIYIDYLQNREGQTICAPYSIRPRPGATASAPLHWDEVKKGLKTEQFTITSLPERVKGEGDLFNGVLERGIDLDSILQALTINKQL